MTERPPVDDAQSERWEAAEEGMELLHSGETALAIDELLRVAHEDPENEYALHFLGHAYFQKEAFPEALKSYVEALKLAPDYVGAMVGAGQTLRMMGEYDRAIRMGKRVLQQQEDDGDGLPTCWLWPPDPAIRIRGRAAIPRGQRR